MLDWEISENNTLPQEAPLPPSDAFRSRRLFWSITIGGIVVVALAIIGVMRGRLEAGESALAADLLALVRAEEQARRFNLVERADLLLAEGTPDEWRNRYLALFDTVTGSTPIEVALEDVRLDGIAALVQARIGTQLQHRYYQLTSQGWRRAPLPIAAWGDSLFTYTYPDHERIRVQYYREDAGFAKEVMDNLPALMATRSALGLDGLDEFSMTITPEELSGPLLDATPTRLVLNSPQLVVLPLDSPLTGSESVQYQIASVLLQNNVETSIADEVLPQHARFASALHTVLALRWAVSSGRYPVVREGWRSHIGNVWHSPFMRVTPSEETMDPSPPPAVSAALLVADAIYEQAGVEGVASTLQLMQSAAGWDEVLMPTIGMKAVELEAMVQGIPAPPIPELPLTGHVAVGSRDNEPSVALHTPTGTHPVELDFPDTSIPIQLPDGEEVPATCLALFSEIRVNGTWREAGRRLMVDQLTVTELRASLYYAVRTPPGNTVSVIGTWGASGELDGLAAVTADGTVTPVFSQAQNEPLIFLTGASTVAQGQSILLTTAALPACPVQWLIAYRPEHGIVAQWLVWWERHLNTPTIYWDEASRSGLMVLENNRLDRGAPYWQLTVDNPLIVGEPDGQLPPGELLGLRPGGEEVMVALPAQDGTPAVVRHIHLKTTRVLARYAAPEWMTRATNALFSHDGRYVFVTWNGQNRYNVNGEVSTILRYDMETGVEAVLWQPSDGNLSYQVVDAHLPILYTITTTGRARARLQRLSDAPPERLYQPSGDDGLSYIAPCTDGGLMVVSFERTIQHSIAEIPKRMMFLDASGNLIKDPMTVESGLPLVCR